MKILSLAAKLLLLSGILHAQYFPGGSSGGLSSFTSPDGSILIGGSLTNPQVTSSTSFMNLYYPQLGASNLFGQFTQIFRGNVADPPIQTVCGSIPTTNPMAAGSRGCAPNGRTYSSDGINIQYEITAAGNGNTPPIASVIGTVPQYSTTGWATAGTPYTIPLTVAAHQILLATSGSAVVTKTINDCTGTGKAITFVQSSDTFGCNTISGASNYYTSTTGTCIGQAACTPASTDTLLLMNTTPIAGVTKVTIQEGEGQAGAGMLNFADFAGSILGKIHTASGELNVNATRFQYITPGVFTLDYNGLSMRSSNTISLNSDTTLARRSQGLWSIYDAIFGAGATPGISGCSATVVGNSIGGKITTGTTGACTPVLTLTATAPIGWACAISDNTTANLFRQTASTTTTVTFSGTAVSGDTLTYVCVGY